MATVLVPTPLRRFTGGQSKVSASAATIGELIGALDAQYPGVAEKLLDGGGEIKRFINVFVNDDEVRSLQGLATPVGDNDRISIVPAMAGGEYKRMEIREWRSEITETVANLQLPISDLQLPRDTNTCHLD